MKSAEWLPEISISLCFQLDLVFWPAVQCLNFYFLPTSLRLICSNSACFAWSMALSLIKHNVSRCYSEVWHAHSAWSMALSLIKHNVSRCYSSVWHTQKSYVRHKSFEARSIVPNPGCGSSRYLPRASLLTMHCVSRRIFICSRRKMKRVEIKRVALPNLFIHCSEI